MQRASGGHVHLQRGEGLLNADLGKVYCLSCSWHRGSSGWLILLAILLLTCIDLNFKRLPERRHSTIPGTSERPHLFNLFPVWYPQDCAACTYYDHTLNMTPEKPGALSPFAATPLGAFSTFLSPFSAMLQATLLPQQRASSPCTSQKSKAVRPSSAPPITICKHVTHQCIRPLQPCHDREALERTLRQPTNPAFVRG